MTNSDAVIRFPPYRPIEEYGIIGNLSSVALVRIDGSIDWCCLPHLDSSSVFAALLDARQGGHFTVRPRSFDTCSQQYLEETNVLVTAFTTSSGRMEVCDFMPTGPTLQVASNPPRHPEMYRRIRCTHGEVEAVVVWAPRHDYARADTTMDRRSDGWVAGGGDAPLGFAGLDEAAIVDAGDAPALVGHLSLRAGDEQYLVTRWGDSNPQLDPAEADRRLDETIDAWTEWVGAPHTGTRRRWAGRWEDELVRSELFLKLMAQRQSGALAAAPTTSLPEGLGGPRNWDYRYTWIRDAAQIAQALFALGHHPEANAFVQWAEHVACDHDDYAGEGLQLMYPLTSHGDLTEQTLDHLDGYRDSSPVRIGNAAVDQLQLDVYGELLNAVCEQLRISEVFDPELRPFLRQITEEATEAWYHPDYGIWEMRNGPFHLVYSKMMTWVALDRACWLCKQGRITGDTDRWANTKRRLRRQILTHGYDDDIEAFVQRFEDPDGRLDAANLLMPTMEFLPADDPRFQSTIDRTLERLVVDDLVYRYRGDDGIAGEEGTFVLCTCWLVDALATSGRLEEAQRIFENLMDRTNHLGLLAEQIDPYSGEFLGNFPQAYSHVGLINSALYLGAKTRHPLPVKPLLGDTAHQ